MKGTDVAGDRSGAKRRNGREMLGYVWALISVLVILIVLGIIVIAGDMMSSGESNTYRAYARVAGSLASFSSMISLLGVLIIKTKKYKIIVGISILIFLLLYFCAEFMATFYITW